jgi:hypothetical protein
MRPKHVAKVLPKFFLNRKPVMLAGPPGAAKTSLILQAAESIDYRWILMHPSISDPTDFKGFPFVIKRVDPKTKKEISSAEFVPFGDLLQVINSTEPTVVFADDLGQAPPAVQAALMQPILARAINNHKIPDCVTWAAATNRREDKAAVGGVLEPVKSRFHSIITVDVNADDWCAWAAGNDMPPILVAFIHANPGLLNKFEPTVDITNGPCPRTIANMGELINIGNWPDDEAKLEVYSGTVGEAVASQFLAYEKVEHRMPDPSDIIKNPDKVKHPKADETDIMFAISTALAYNIDKNNATNIFKWMDGLNPEFSVLMVKDACNMPTAKTKNAFTNSNAFQKWAVNHADIVL